MSKSLGNFFTVSEILAKGYTGRELRFALIRVQYRQSLNFTLAGLTEGRAAIARVNEARKNLVRIRDGADREGGDDLAAAVQTANDTFTASMQDDLNVSEALAAIFDFVTTCNKAASSVAGATVALQAFARFEDVLAVFGDEPEVAGDAPAELVALLDQRKDAKASKDWAAADKIREEIAAAGWKIVDTPAGARLEKV
jgi:cysteinyl-tRNA synthetase